jgi:hypothetical protein
VVAEILASPAFTWMTFGTVQVQWRRGMAWAFEQAMGLVWYYEVSNSLVSLWGRRTHAGSPTS